MDSVPFAEVLEYLEEQGYSLLGSRGNERVFRKGRSFLRIEVRDRKVSQVDFQTIQAIVEDEEGGFGRLGRRR